MKRIVILLGSILLIVIVVLITLILNNGGVLHLTGGAINNDFHDSLKVRGNYSTSSFIRKIDTAKIGTAEINIDLLDIIELLESLDSNQGFLFYPGLISSDANEVVYLMAVLNEDSNRIEDEIYVLDEDFSDYGLLKKSKIKFDTTYFNNYNRYLIPIDSSYKKATRYYSKSELVEMLLDCKVDIYDENLEKYKRWNFEIKGSAIKTLDISYLKMYHPTQKPVGYDWKYHVGFTVVLRVKQWGIQRGPAYEIGRPCPPRCGELAY